MKSQLIAIVAAVLLVGCGPSVNIWEAAANGNIEAVKQHLDAGVDVNAKGGGSWTPLQWAAFYGHKETAELLIAKGADVNAKDEDGMTPLHITAYYGYKEGSKEIIELLIAKGAEVNTLDKYTGNTALDSAILLKHTEIADLLRKHGGKTAEELKAGGK